MDSETRKEAVQKILVSVPEYMQKVQCDTDEWYVYFCSTSIINAQINISGRSRLNVR